MESLDRSKIYEFEGLFSNKFIENIKYKSLNECTYHPLPVTNIKPKIKVDHLPIKDSIQFVSTLINKLSNSKLLNEIEDINFKNNMELLFPLSTVLNELGMGFYLDNLIRAKTNIIPINEQNNKYIHIPHIDIHNDDCWTMLYFINSNNGKTHFLKTDREEKLNIYKSITPKEGKCVFFHSSNFHCGSTQNDEVFRMVINYNYII